MTTLSTEAIQTAMQRHDLAQLQSAIAAAEEVGGMEEAAVMKEAKRAAMELTTAQLNRSRLRSALSSFVVVESVDEVVVAKAKAVALQLVRSSRISLMQHTHARNTASVQSAGPLVGMAPPLASAKEN